MLYCRFKSGDEAGWGLVEEHEVWEVQPDLFDSPQRTGRRFPMDEVRWLPPCLPSKIVAVGLNYKDHIEELGRQGAPSEPVIFLKPPTAVIGIDEPIVIPRGVSRVDYEAELGLVISKSAYRVPEEKAADHILGCVCFNDVTARDLQKKDGQWTRSKSFDTFAPLGPWISSGLPYQNLRVEAYLNGRVVQQGHTSQMLFPVTRLVSFISNVMTLLPGDVIATGTPMGVGPIKAGDVIEIFVEGVGKLRNPVTEERRKE